MGSKNQSVSTKQEWILCGRDSVRVGSPNLSSFLIPPFFEMPARGQATPARPLGWEGKEVQPPVTEAAALSSKCEEV